MQRMHMRTINKKKLKEEASIYIYIYIEFCNIFCFDDTLKAGGSVAARAARSAFFVIFAVRVGKGRLGSNWTRYGSVDDFDALR